MDNQLQDIINPIFNADAYYHEMSVDTVIFGYHEGSLKVLLLRPANFDLWMLPGGYIRKNESAERAARNVVFSRTRLDAIETAPVGVYSNPDRMKNGRSAVMESMRSQGINIPDDFWMFNQFVSLGYMALTEYAKVQPSGSFYAEDVRWWSLDDLPQLIYDHAQIISEAKTRLKYIAYTKPIGYDLLPEKFTLPEIRTLYETVLEKKFDDRNFAKKMTNLGIITKLDETRAIGPHRSPYLYTFNKDRYDELMSQVGIIQF